MVAVMTTEHNKNRKHFVNIKRIDSSHLTFTNMKKIKAWYSFSAQLFPGLQKIPTVLEEHSW